MYLCMHVFYKRTQPNARIKATYWWPCYKNSTTCSKEIALQCTFSYNRLHVGVFGKERKRQRLHFKKNLFCFIIEWVLPV